MKDIPSILLQELCNLHGVVLETEKSYLRSSSPEDLERHNCACEVFNRVWVLSGKLIGDEETDALIAKVHPKFAQYAKL